MTNMLPEQNKVQFGMPMGTLDVAADPFLAAAERDQKRKAEQMEAAQNMAKTKAKEEKKAAKKAAKQPSQYSDAEDAPKNTGRVFIAGPSIPVHPGNMPAWNGPRDSRGRATRNPEYHAWKARAADFNSEQQNQRAIQGHSAPAVAPAASSAQFGAIHIPGKHSRPVGYDVNNRGGIGKQRMAGIQQEATAINNLRTENTKRMPAASPSTQA